MLVRQATIDDPSCQLGVSFVSEFADIFGFSDLIRLLNPNPPRDRILDQRQRFNPYSKSVSIQKAHRPCGKNSGLEIQLIVH
jgi:hypothetical protein